MNGSLNRARNGGATRLEMVKDMAEDFVSRSQELLHLAGKGHPHHPYTVDVHYETRYTSRRARLISVILYVMTVSVGAVIMGTYYMFGWHPNTSNLFGRRKDFV